MDWLQKNTDLDRNTRRKEADRMMKNIQNPRILRDLSDAITGPHGVYCLTEKNNNLLMWAHYANSHQGYCLEFSTELAGSFFNNAEPVRYKQDYPIVQLFSGDKLEQAKEGLLTKSFDWKYEKEWRLRSEVPGHGKFPEESLVGLIVGCRIDQNNLEKIKNWNSKRGSPVILKEAVRHEDQFRLIIRDLDHE